MKLPWASARSPSWPVALSSLLLVCSQLVTGIELDVHSKKSIKRAAEIAAKGLLAYYPGDAYAKIPGLLDYPPYFWWESGAMWMSFVDYWWYTGDNQFNDIITRSILSQAGPGRNFIDAAQSFDNGNDDQAFWAFAAMDAAELKFPNPPKGQPQWLALAQAVFNVQLTRFTDSCGGGLPWQVESTTPGYYYKNTISNGCFFSLAARLARYTGNMTYAHYAVTTYDWMRKANLIDDYWQIWDGVDTTNQTQTCQVNGIQWTYNAGVVLHGAATMWDITKQHIWRERINGIISNLHIFFQDGVMFEQYCEGSTTHPCNVDQQSFKGYLARWMAVCTQLAPWTHPQLMPLLKKSAAAAAAQCTGGDSGTECGLRWTVNGTTGKFDGEVGAGEQIAALSIFGSLLTPPPHSNSTKVPVTAKSGGISKGNPGAGLQPQTIVPMAGNIINVTTADRGGAWFLTVIFALLTLIGAAWALKEEGSPWLSPFTRHTPRRSGKTISEKAFSEKLRSPMGTSSNLGSPNPDGSRMASPAIPSPVLASPTMASSIRAGSLRGPSVRGSPRVGSPQLISPGASKRTSINSRKPKERTTSLRQPPPSPA